MDKRDLPGPELSAEDIRRWTEERETRPSERLIPEITPDDIRRWLERKKRAQE